MKKVYEYSHLGGSQILKVDYPEIDKEIDAVIDGIAGLKKTKKSKEKKRGRFLKIPKPHRPLFQKKKIKKRNARPKTDPKKRTDRFRKYHLECPRLPGWVKGTLF